MDEACTIFVVFGIQPNKMKCMDFEAGMQKSQIIIRN